MSQPKEQKSSPSFDVLSGLAHELDGPLKSLAKTSQKLVDEYKTRDFEYISYKDFKGIITTLEQMNKQLLRCAQTTEGMIRLRRDKSNKTNESCQVNDVIKSVLSLLDQQFKKAKVKIAARLSADMPMAKISGIDCHQIIHNVFINAIQAMPAGGKLKINTSVNKSKSRIFIDIEDEGVGITEEHLIKVFEPFFTTKERGVEKSSGLGLSIVYSIVHSIGGDIQIESSLRKGTAVHIELPIVS